MTTPSEHFHSHHPPFPPPSGLYPIYPTYTPFLPLPHMIPIPLPPHHHQPPSPLFGSPIGNPPLTPDSVKLPSEVADSITTNPSEPASSHKEIPEEELKDDSVKSVESNSVIKTRVDVSDNTKKLHSEKNPTVIEAAPVSVICPLEVAAQRRSPRSPSSTHSLESGGLPPRLQQHQLKTRHHQPLHPPPIQQRKVSISRSPVSSPKRLRMRGLSQSPIFNRSSSQSRSQGQGPPLHFQQNNNNNNRPQSHQYHMRNNSNWPHVPSNMMDMKQQPPSGPPSSSHTSGTVGGYRNSFRGGAGGVNNRYQSSQTQPHVTFYSNSCNDNYHHHQRRPQHQAPPRGGYNRHGGFHNSQQSQPSKN